MIWLLIGAMATLTSLALILPLMRRDTVGAASGLGVFEGQLEELRRDVELGLVDPGEARAAEQDIRRRAQAAETRQAPDAGEASPRLRLALMAASLAAVMAAVVIYMQIGAPQLVSPPSAEPPQPPQGMQAVLAEIDALAADLMANPDNPQGWAVLGQAYLQLGRFDEAAIAFENAIDRTSGNAALFAALGQAYLFAADGEMVPAAREAFARRARYRSAECAGTLLHGRGAFPGRRARSGDCAVATDAGRGAGRSRIPGDARGAHRTGARGAGRRLDGPCLPRS